MCEFESLFNLHPIPSWVYSVSTLRFLAVNQAAIECYGFTRQQFLDMTIEEIRPVEDIERLRGHLRESARPQPSIWRHFRSDGSCIDVEIESTALKFKGEDARLVTARNVSGQLNNLDRLHLALSAGKFAVWEYNLADGSLCWDPTYTGVYGIDRSLFPKDQPQFLSMVEPQFRELLVEAFEKCVTEGAPYDCEFRLNLPGVGVRWRHAIGKRIQDSAGKAIKIIGIGIDITERKKMEEDGHRSRRLESVGRLASGIAHDFNNILTVISGYAHLIRFGNEPDFSATAATEICAASDRAARLVKQLLDFSRKLPLDPQPIEINGLVADTAVLIRRLLPESISINVDIVDEVLQVSADRGQVEQLVMNLCLNARDAMQESGLLTVSVTRVGDCAWITISDTGTGIVPSVQAKMFEPFFTTKEVGSGTGLGLSIVHGIVQQLNGQIAVESTPGQGSTFIVQLPLALACRSE